MILFYITLPINIRKLIRTQIPSATDDEFRNNILLYRKFDKNIVTILYNFKLSPEISP